MELPNTYLSLHAIEHVEATPGVALGSPVLLRFEGAHGTLQLAVFFRDEDADYTARLIEAINGVRRQPREPDPLEQAAYVAEGIVYVYQGSER